MKSTLLLISLLAMPIHLSAQSPRYTVTDLGPSNNPFSQATGLDNFGLVTGVATATDGSQHAVFWLNGVMTDIGKPGLGGANSGAGGVNEFGQILGQAETPSRIQIMRIFCGYGSGLQCLLVFVSHGPARPAGLSEAARKIVLRRLGMRGR